jgi:hypothetical protein
MRGKWNFVRSCVLGAVLWFGLQGRAMAYLDMTTGSYFIQLLISSALSGLLFIKLPWVRLKDFVQKAFGRKENRNES